MRVTDIRLTRTLEWIKNGGKEQMQEILLTQQLDVASVEKLNEFSVQLGWDINYSQLGCIEATGSYLEGVGSSLTTTRKNLPGALSIRSGGFPGHLAVATYRSKSPARINGLEMNTNRFFMAPPNSEFEMVTQGSGDLQIAIVPQGRIGNILTDSGSKFDRLLESQQVISSDDIDNTGAFQNWFERWSRNVTGQENTSFVDSEIVLGEILANSLHTLMDTEFHSNQSATKFKRSKSDICRLIDYFHAYPMQVIPTEKMIEISGLCRRSLFYHFKNYTGYTPLQYFNRIRLSACRKHILSCPKSLTSIALDYNFYHLGEFSAFYKSIYDELPSESRTKTRNGHFGDSDQIRIESDDQSHVGVKSCPESPSTIK